MSAIKTRIVPKCIHLHTIDMNVKNETVENVRSTKNL